MDFYIFEASLFCVKCAKELMEENQDCYMSKNSFEFPQGPYHQSEYEADSPQHCAKCGNFLQNPLTQDGLDNVYDCIIEDLNNFFLNKSTKDWIEFYGITLKDLMEYVSND